MFELYGGAILAIPDNSPLYMDPHVCDGDFISSSVRLHRLYYSQILSIQQPGSLLESVKFLVVISTPSSSLIRLFVYRIRALRTRLIFTVSLTSNRFVRFPLQSGAKQLKVSQSVCQLTVNSVSCLIAPLLALSSAVSEVAFHISVSYTGLSISCSLIRLIN